VWAVLKQLLSTNWLNKSAVKGEVSLVSFRNFWFCRVRTNGMTCVSPSLNCLSSKWHESRHFSFVCDRFEDKQGISLTTWMVVGEIDRWSTNFKFFAISFCCSPCWMGTFWNGILLFWRKQIIPFVLIVFFGHLFLWQRFISVQKTCCCCPSLMRCHKNRDVGSLGRD